MVVVFAVVVAVVVGVIGWLAGLGLLALVPAVVLAVLAVWVANATCERVTLRSIGATPSPPERDLRLHNLVEGLCVAAGLPKPRLHVVDDPALNACAVGRGPRTASVVVTRGLLESMDRIELEAVLAHELARVRDHDTLPATLAVVLVGFPALAGPIGRPFHPLVRAGMRRCVGPRRTFEADVAAVDLTRYPPGLIAALGRIQQEGSAVPSASVATAPLWIAPADGGDDPPLQVRIAALREL
jgi:heat shock protein HtpX